jgi:hypothetical protein
MAERMLTLCLLGGSPELERELKVAALALGVAVLPDSARDRADVLLVADGPAGSALDLVRGESRAAPGRPILAVGEHADALDASLAMGSGARGLLVRPLAAEALRSALGRAGCFDEPGGSASGSSRLVLVLGAAGGVGATTVAVALGIAASGVVADLDLASGDAAAVAGARVEAPDALLSLALAPRVARGEVAGQLARGRGCDVLPAPTLAEQGDLVDEGGVARVLDALGEDGPVVVVDGGQRIGVETVPALERAAAILVVAPADRRGVDGALRVCGLLGRLGFGDRPLGIAAARVPARGAPKLADALRLPVWGRVRELRSIARARQVEQAPPPQPFAALAARVLDQLDEARASR